MSRKPAQVAKKLNDHHSRTCAGFYASNSAAGAGRYFGARVKDGKLEISNDFGGTWQQVTDLDVAEFHDHNGRRIFL